MFVFDPQTVRDIDAATIEAGTPGLHLMERAGAGAARAILDRPGWLWGTSLVVCGKGNNGGDGLVVARLLHGEGHAVAVALTAGPSDLTGDALENLNRLRSLEVPVVELGPDPGPRLRRESERRPGRLVVDAVLGTGFQPPLRPPLDSLAAAMGSLGRRLVALDAPTGLDGATGAVDPHTPVADLTLTFGFPKWGQFLAPGRAHCGRVERVDLAFPRAVVERAAASAPESALYVDRALAAGWWEERAVDAHKYQAGSVAVVGGSRGMSGAVALATLGAYRGGAGLVEALVPGGQALAVDIQCPEALVRGLPETADGGLSPAGLASLVERTAAREVTVLGPGAGADLETAETLLRLVDSLEGALVLDADALNAYPRLQRDPHFRIPTVLTPHSGELGRLLGMPAQVLEEDRRRWIREAAAAWNAVVLHKGAPTFVAAPDGTLAVVGSGGPALATAGTGDVLAGVIGALLAAGTPPFEAACQAAYLHGRAGDRAERLRGAKAVMARDLLDELGPAQRELEETRR